MAGEVFFCISPPASIFPSGQNLTHSSFFNLVGTGDILNHRVQILVDKFTPCGRVAHSHGRIETSGRTPFDFRDPAMEVLSTGPGMQFYSGNFLDDTIRGRDDMAYPFRNAFCMELQYHADSPKQSQFPSTAISPDWVRAGFVSGRERTRRI